jgi:hypothetical protein
MPLLLVFDIDETLIQFINNTKRYNPTPYDYWKNISKEQRKNFSSLWDVPMEPMSLRRDMILNPING